ncbi:50S ribosomal protein L22 [Candidatus Parcubacteria bacterium A4]|nr:MAG: 50S ribosomal protein L22 [Candidatus Parcubacteria bacterium A4]
MNVSVKLKYLRIAPRKVRIIADLIRGKSFEIAQAILSFTNKKGADDLLNLLNQAAANAENNFQLEKNNLQISKIIVDEGPKLKRWLPRARGKADRLEKKTSHITMTLEEINETAIKKTKAELKTDKDALKVSAGEDSKEGGAFPKKFKKENIFKVKKTDIKKEGRKTFRRKAF